MLPFHSGSVIPAIYHKAAAGFPVTASQIHGKVYHGTNFRFLVQYIFSDMLYDNRQNITFPPSHPHLQAWQTKRLQ